MTQASCSRSGIKPEIRQQRFDRASAKLAVMLPGQAPATVEQCSLRPTLPDRQMIPNPTPAPMQRDDTDHGENAARQDHQSFPCDDVLHRRRSGDVGGKKWMQLLTMFRAALRGKVSSMLGRSSSLLFLRSAISLLATPSRTTSFCRRLMSFEEVLPLRLRRSRRKQLTELRVRGRDNQKLRAS